MRHCIHSVVLAFILLFPASREARAFVNVKTRVLTATDGLSSNSVRYMFQDSRGFIWMSTANGLNRYDGNSIVAYLPQKGGSVSLADRYVRYLREDKNGFLWINVSPDMFSCYDLRRDRFVDFTGCGEYRHRYSDILITDDAVWLYGKSGCRRVVCSGGSLSSEAFTAKGGQLLSDNVCFVGESAGGVWIGTAKGLYRYSGGRLTLADEANGYYRMESAGGKTFFVTTGGTVMCLRGGSVAPVCRLPVAPLSGGLSGVAEWRGRLLFMTPRGGYVLDPASLTMHKAGGSLDIANGQVMEDNLGDSWIFNRTGQLRWLDSRADSVRVFRLLPQEKVGLIDRERYYVVRDASGRIWISTYGNGLFSCDAAGGDMRHYTVSNDIRANLIPSDYLLFLMADRSGGLWAASEFNGVSHISMANPAAHFIYPEGDAGVNVPGNAIRMVAMAGNGDLWIGNRDGEVFEYSADLSVMRRKLTFGTNIYTVCRDTAGTDWIGTRTEGLVVGGRTFRHDSGDSSSLAENAIFCILRDRRGRMWIGTFGGGLDLACADGKGGYTFRHFFNTSYGQSRIRAICEDRNGWIWLGTSSGIIVFDPDRLTSDSRAFHSYSWDGRSIRSNEVHSIMADSKGRVWIAETGAGLCVCSPGRGGYGSLRFTHYDTRDGLVNNQVQGMAEDSSGRIWISTGYGVSCLEPDSKEFSNYFFSSVMPGNICNENAMVRLPGGCIVAGTQDGLAVINPAKTGRSKKDLAVTFTSLRVDGIPVVPGEDGSPLAVAMSYTRRLRLGYDQNTFAVDFSTMDYSFEKPKYSYMLENYDDGWSVPSALNFASYSKLPPGTYRLRVRACTPEGVWGSRESVLEIVVASPWWATPWAYAVYALLLAGACAAAFRILRNINRLHNSIEVERQLTEYKLVFFTNISHEFRTPLTLIQASLEHLRGLRQSRETAYSLDTMRRSAARMMRLVNQLIDFRRMEKDKLSLSLRETDVVAFLKSVYDNFRDVASQRNIDYRFEPSQDSLVMYADRDNLDKVVYNLLSNAFKYTPAGGRVTLSVGQDADRRLVIRVADTGVGVPAGKRGSLFTRFTHNNMSEHSMGIGLHLVHGLVTAHKGTVAYGENPGGGSVFTVCLPADREAYDEGDFLMPENALLESAETGGASAAEGDTAAPAEPPAPLNDCRILVIEDDPDVCGLLSHELSAYAVVSACHDGKSGLDFVAGNDVDLIICDVMMPGMSGFEVVRRLKEDFATCHIPVILLTALSADDSRLKGIESGADSYITKPFSPQMLRARVFKLIEQRDRLKEKFSKNVTMVRPLISTTQKDKEFADKLTGIVEAQLGNSDFVIDDFASEMGLGRTALYRKVKGVTGYSPKEYLRVMRMKKAAELLLSGDVTVSEVAYRVGMTDPFNFSKCFKQQFGVAPSVFQKNKGTGGGDQRSQEVTGVSGRL